MGPSRGTQPLLLRIGVATIAAAGRACGSNPAGRWARTRHLRRKRADSRSRSVAQSEKTSHRYVRLSLAPRALVDASRLKEAAFRLELIQLRRERRRLHRGVG